MKKILAILSIFIGTTTLSANVIACKSMKMSLDIKNIYWYNVYNQRYDTCNRDIYNNIYNMIANYFNAVDPNPSLFISDKNMTVTILDNNNELVNDSTKIDINSIENNTFKVDININEHDEYFNTTAISSGDINIGPVDNPNWTNSDFNSIFNDNPTNGSDAYKDVRTYIANYINISKKVASDLTEDDINMDQQIGISLWSNNDFISDDSKNINLTSVKILIGPNINVKDQYFINNNQVLIINK